MLLKSFVDMRHKCIFAFQWTLATAVGFVLAEIMVRNVPYIFFLFFFPLLGCVYGLAVGTLQWLVLRRYLLMSSSWITANILGFTGGALLLWGALLGGLGDANGFLTWVCFIPIIGFAHWAVVLRRLTSRAGAGFWVLASTLGYSAPVAVLVFRPNFLSVVDQITTPLIDLIDGYRRGGIGHKLLGGIGHTLFGGIVAGGVTGISLLWLLSDKSSKTYEGILLRHTDRIQRWRDSLVFLVRSVLQIISANLLIRSLLCGAVTSTLTILFFYFWLPPPFANFRIVYGYVFVWLGVLWWPLPFYVTLQKLSFAMIPSILISLFISFFVIWSSVWYIVFYCARTRVR